MFVCAVVKNRIGKSHLGPNVPCEICLIESWLLQKTGLVPRWLYGVSKGVFEMLKGWSVAGKLEMCLVNGCCL